MSFTDINLQSYTPPIKISRKFGLLKYYSKINSTVSETKFIVNVKIKQSRYRPGVAQRVPGS
jgi:hypothetical protein